MNDEIIIFQLQKCFDLKTNREVANFLGLSESMVSKILKGKKSLSLFYRLKILCKFGYVRDLTAEIGPEQLGVKLIALSIANAQSGVGAVLPNDSGATDFDGNDQEVLDEIDIKALKNRGSIALNLYCSHLIKAFERLFQFKNNESLAEALGVDSSTISNIKNGRHGIGEGSCLKILYRIEGDFDLNFVERVTSSTELLAELIDAYHD
ncbi:MAG: hypothetical protein Q8K07_21130 [Methylicorpusculum sp.]|uniref:hypothetical protein n=1 Tax=Methylicorpusculum sp. TaxID=2713644 RepID=UPI00272F0060|nr:hypothetical protein [Methylicorpusculum sp.]MDP2204528.1 hypothetical protein [Methylicorpusculum sp.]